MGFATVFLFKLLCCCMLPNSSFVLHAWAVLIFMSLCLHFYSFVLRPAGWQHPVWVLVCVQPLIVSSLVHWCHKLVDLLVLSLTLPLYLGLAYLWTCAHVNNGWQPSSMRAVRQVKLANIIFWWWRISYTRFQPLVALKNPWFLLKENKKKYIYICVFFICILYHIYNV